MRSGYSQCFYVGIGNVSPIIPDGRATAAWPRNSLFGLNFAPRVDCILYPLKQFRKRLLHFKKEQIQSLFRRIVTECSGSRRRLHRFPTKVASVNENLSFQNRVNFEPILDGCKRQARIRL